MANIAITSDAWTEISITSGTIQNISATADIELSAEQTDNSGVVLKPSEIYQWDNETIYARAVTEDTGALRVVNFKRAAGGGGYVLPVASSSTLGGVKVGNNLSIDESGVLSANAGGYTLPPATTSTLGGVKVGTNLSIDGDGVLSASTDPVGRVVYDVILRTGYIKANGATVANASTAVPDLLQFVQNNPSLLAADAAAYATNVGLYLYDSGTDELTLPIYTGRTMQGGNSVESVAAGLPNITGTVSCNPRLSGSSNILAISVGNEAGAFSSDRDSTTYSSVTNADGVATSFVMKFSAASSNPIYSDSVATVQPPAITMIPQIKY